LDYRVEDKIITKEKISESSNTKRLKAYADMLPERIKKEGEQRN